MPEVKKNRDMRERTKFAENNNLFVFRDGMEDYEYQYMLKAC